ncbi:MAG: RNA-dependent RNA polymerase [Sanya tombus-like virus 2]|nr:MAG: RNA-dependent RNA polymerase [Sanya tombus-like virus 2]
MPEDYEVTRRRGVVLGPAPPPFMEVVEYGLHEHTIDQEVRTLCNRHLFKTPEPQVKSRAWKGFCREMRAISRRIGTVPRATVNEVIGNRSSMKRKRFGQGMQRYCRFGVRRQDSFLTEMQKLEFYAEDKIESKEDRGIQFRSPTYNAALARHLHNVEHRAYARLRNADGTPMIAKGRSPLERGLLLDAMARQYSEPMFLLMDHSRFDAHVNAQLLDEEHKLYLRCRNYNRELQQLLKWQKSNIGFSHGGIVYKITAKRCSGDLNTGLGNSLINLALIRSYLAAIKSVNHHILLDGDDSVVIMERRDVSGVEDHMLKCGMVTEASVVYDIQEAEFCQSRVCYGSLGPVMVRNPHKVLDVLTKSPRVLDRVQARGVLAASALGEVMQAPGVPVISTAASSLLTMASSVPRFTTPDAYERFMVYKTDRVVTTVDADMRSSFEAAWGITAQEQMAIEEFYSAMAPPTAEIPPIKPPKNVDPEQFDVYDDILISEIDFRQEDPWWCRDSAIGQIVLGSR